MLERAQCGLVLVENGSPLGSPPLTVVGAIGHRAPVRARPPGHYEESGSRAPALPRASSDRCSYGCQALGMAFSSLFQVMNWVLRAWLLDCGQDREGPQGQALIRSHPAGHGARGRPADR